LPISTNTSVFIYKDAKEENQDLQTDDGRDPKTEEGGTKSDESKGSRRRCTREGG